MNTSSITIGSLIILMSFSIGLLFCLFICMTFFMRNRDGSKMTCSSCCLQHQMRTSDINLSRITSPQQPSISSTLPPTSVLVCQKVSGIAQEEVLSDSSPLSPFGARTNFRTFLALESEGESPVFPPKENSRCSSKVGGVISRQSTISLPSKTVRPCTLLLNQPSTASSLDPPYQSSDLFSLDDVLERFSHSSDFKVFPSDTDESVSSPQVPMDDGDVPIHDRDMPMDDGDVPMDDGSPVFSKKEEKLKLKIGYVKIKVKFLYMSNSLQVDVLRDFYFPHKNTHQESDLYVKLVIVSGHRRMRRSKRINSDQCDSVAATFDHQINSEELLKASMIVSLCKNLDNEDQGILIGSATVRFQVLGIKDAFTEDFVSEIIELPLQDSSPHQLMDCGGYLEMSVEYRFRQEEILLNNLTLSRINLASVQFVNSRGAVYLKVTVYENGKAVCWNRTSPVSVSSATQNALLSDQLVLKMTPKNAETSQVILSVRLKTGKRGERKILGDLNLDQPWSKFENVLFPLLREETASSKFNLKVPLQSSN